MIEDYGLPSMKLDTYRELEELSYKYHMERILNDIFDLFKNSYNGQYYTGRIENKKEFLEKSLLGWFNSPEIYNIDIETHTLSFICVSAFKKRLIEKIKKEMM